jgi:hopene-associated glycosyltransferase HpnB
LSGAPIPPGWAGKVWAMKQGVALAGGADYLLFTDADISFAPGAVAALVRVAESRGLDLVSQMARLHAATLWERSLIPAFVYFFAQLYPFRWVNRRQARTAAAAGGCMLVRREALAEAGGLERIRDALIDDVSLGRLLKRREGSGGVWLGHGMGVTSVRPHPHLRDLWTMVARSAYTQLRHAPALVVGTVVGMALLYAVPPVATVVGLVALAMGGSRVAAVVAGCGLAAWATMAATYVPTLRLYGLSGVRAVGLPGVAMVYAAMTVDSARRHHRGTGGAWKGRTFP